MKLLKTLLILFTIGLGLQASTLNDKYTLYTKYLNIKKLDLTQEQLSKVVPKLERKMKKDRFYNEYMKKLSINRKKAKILKEESRKSKILNKYHIGIMETEDHLNVLICDVTRNYSMSQLTLACYGNSDELVSLRSLYQQGWKIVATPLSGKSNQQIILER